MKSTNQLNQRYSQRTVDVVDNVISTKSVIPLSDFMTKESEFEAREANLKKKGLWEMVKNIPPMASLNLISSSFLVSRDPRIIEKGCLPDGLTAQIKGFDLLVEAPRQGFIGNEHNIIFENLVVSLQIGEKIYFECPLEMYRQSPARTRYSVNFESRVHLNSCTEFRVELTTRSLVLPDHIVEKHALEKETNSINVLLNLNVLLARPVQ